MCSAIPQCAAVTHGCAAVGPSLPAAACLCRCPTVCFQTVCCGCTAALLHEAEEQLLADRREIMRTVPLGIAKSREWKRAVRLWCAKQVGVPTLGLVAQPLSLLRVLRPPVLYRRSQPTSTAAVHCGHCTDAVRCCDRSRGLVSGGCKASGRDRNSGRSSTR
jgi:hypothetical protein